MSLEQGTGLSHTGDDIAILMTHERGAADESIHRLAWDAFRAGTEVAKEQPDRIS